ncbi:MAG: DUF4838 domain-containing protein, partial [Candidatus Hydrogenedentes bacterium]|nr:DUF4838 domain-containing protein [Candidatus Hydrogenedentota bacterium]
ERIEKTHPDVILSTYAYQYTRKPPKTLRARKNVMIQLCSIECCDFHAIDDPSCALNQIFCEDTAGWKKKADTIFIWHYNTNFRGYMLPFPNFRAIGKSVQYFSENNGRGVFMQAAGNGFSTELSDLRNYVMARCLWKPGRDSWQEVEEFCRLHYAEAAQPILDYLAYYHDLVGKAGVHPTCFPTESALALNSESAAQIMRHFEDALALAKSDEVRARVEKASLCAYRAALSAASMRLVYDNGLCRADASTMPPGLLDTYAALCARYEVSMEGEQTTLTQYLDDMRNLLDGVKAVQIENDFWRVMLLPEFNGKIVEMTYKPTGRNVIQPARTLSRFRFEDWVRQGEGPGSQSILAYEAQAEADKALFTLTTPDGSRFERRISLAGESVRVEMALTAQGPRMADFQVHPEYDTATTSESPGVLQIFVKAPGWTQANGDWSGALPTEAQSALIKTAAAGGSFAYYNQEARFGVEQRFDPEEYASLGLFWGPSRLQINLEMLPKIVSLAAGQQARYAYEIRYLHEAPQGAPL